MRRGIPCENRSLNLTGDFRVHLLKKKSQSSFSPGPRDISGQGCKACNFHALPLLVFPPLLSILSHLSSQQTRFLRLSLSLSGKMAASKEKPRRVVRGVKTLFFVISMLVSLLLFSAPVLLVITDAIAPSALFSAFISPRSIGAVHTHIKNYDFRSSMIDIPLLSIARSIVILCVYCVCDGPGLSHGPYLGVTTLCSLASMVFVSFKACVFRAKMDVGEDMIKVQEPYFGLQQSWLLEAMFLCSLVLAVGHVVVAYRTSCRERRKLLVYRIDLEAVSACKNGFPTYHKVLQVRAK